MILIATVANDLHAQLVKAIIGRDGRYACHILELDRIAQRAALTYGISYEMPGRVIDSDDKEISVGDASVLWLRRVPARQHFQWPIEDSFQSQIVDGDCRGAAIGLLKTHFKGHWVSSVDATIRASDKIWQLSVANECGFRVPRTLVTQSAKEVQIFFDLHGPIVVKTVVGASGPMLQTIRIDDPTAFSADEYQAAPAIYQEYISGSHHLRLTCFGDRSYAGLIDTPDVDWRGNLDVSLTQCDVSESLHTKVRTVLDALGLAMGIVDIKLAADDEPVWLEVNPQGQFAFLDGLAGTNLVRTFAEYLIRSCSELDSKLSAGAGQGRPA
jgi:glutathione synthase/RimK-type ligase-like ATP-grasp enzyme